MPLSDNELIERILSHERHLYGDLIRRYERKAMTLAMRMLRNREDAEEAVQDAFMRAYNGLSRFARNSTFGTWFYRILYNGCCTKLRSRGVELETSEFNEEHYDPAERFPDAPSLEEELEVRDMIGIVRNIIDSLPQKYSIALTLFYLEECSHDRISEITGLPLGTVKVHLFRGRAILLRRVAEKLRLEAAAQ